MPFCVGIMFRIVPIMVAICFIVVFGTIIVRSVKGIKEWKENNDSPVLTVDASVVTKRTDVHYHHNNVNQNMHRSSSTTYYVTFEVESGNRIEFRMQGNQYGMIVEGDKGKLTFQGTRYLKFNHVIINIPIYIFLPTLYFYIYAYKTLYRVQGIVL